MRSRSSRLFVVLLHLVGVSTNLPRNSFLAAFFPNGLPSGIVGVNPMTILLEPLELKAAGGLEKLLEIFEAAGHDIDETFLNEPYWLQVCYQSRFLANFLRKIEQREINWEAAYKFNSH